jgi:hypothetical protein
MKARKRIAGGHGGCPRINGGPIVFTAQAGREEFPFPGKTSG